jgi:hypothetical protein
MFVSNNIFPNIAAEAEQIESGKVRGKFYSL